jgi:hypothetical protein
MPLKLLFWTLVAWCLGAMPATAVDTVQTVKIHPNGPVYTLRTIVNPQAEHCKLGEPCLVGWIRVYTQGAAVPLQTMEFRTHAHVSLFAGEPRIEDVNFDGYQDIYVVNEVAGKWGSFQYRLFDPRTGRFVKSVLANELTALRHNGLVFDSTTKQIHLAHFVGQCYPSRKTYTIFEQRLALVHADELFPAIGREQCLSLTVNVSPAARVPLAAHDAFIDWVTEPGALEQRERWLDHSTWQVHQLSRDHFTYASELKQVRVRRSGNTWVVAEE